MKGIIFSEFVEMVEDSFSPEIADEIISESELASGGAYTSVGNYDYREMLALITKLSEKTGIAVEELVIQFGAYMFRRFYELYPEFFQGSSTAFDFLASIEEHVHVEVLNLYPDAELPSFDISRPGPETLVMVYRSQRPVATMALGLMQGCIKHYGEDVSITQEDFSTAEQSHVRFTLQRQR